MLLETTVGVREGVVLGDSLGSALVVGEAVTTAPTASLILLEAVDRDGDTEKLG